MPQASCSYSSEARPEMVSTINSAGWLVRLRALRTSSGWVTQLVEVSLWTTSTALILCARSAASLASISLDVGAAAPVGRHEFDVELEFLGDAAPQHRELAGLGQQHLVAGRQRIDDRGFPGAGARRRIDDDRLLGAENALAARQHGIDRVRRIPRRGDPGSACPWPAAPGRVRWSVLESEENAFQYAGSSGVLPGGSVSQALEYHYSAGLSPAQRTPHPSNGKILFRTPTRSGRVRRSTSLRPPRTAFPGASGRRRSRRAATAPSTSGTADTSCRSRRSRSRPPAARRSRRGPSRYSSGPRPCRNISARCPSAPTRSGR